jgi:hypothetical protein
MSAYVVDPRTIDYLVAWAQRHRYQRSGLQVRIPRTLAKADLPAWLDYQPGDSFYAVSVRADELGQLLMAANVKSVRHRYPDCPTDDMPGPVDQRNVWRYRFTPIQADLNAAWVIKSCDCLDYQSCEVEDWRDSLAYAVVQAIREDAIGELTDDAPWGVSDEDLQPKPSVR